MSERASISVVITTYQRPDACERAVRSVLAQTLEPLEVIVCDDGSTDDTQQRFEEWASVNPKLRYLRLERNVGSPGAARNLGIKHARGDWVAFLDDDDEWLPTKLEVQSRYLSLADLVATNALRGGTHAYFPDAPSVLRPTGMTMRHANALIISSVVARRDHLIRTGGFPTQRAVFGIEDYALWLALHDRGTRMIVLGEPLVSYDDVSAGRMSKHALRMQLAVARLMWRRAFRRRAPADWAAALRHSAITGSLALSAGTKALR